MPVLNSSGSLLLAFHDSLNVVVALWTSVIGCFPGTRVHSCELQIRLADAHDT